MTLGVLRINDIALQVISQQGITGSAGAAVLLDDGLQIGDQAAESLMLHPRRVVDQYWQSPDMVPLKTASPLVRHHADLVYHHLQKIAENAAEIDEWILVVPASLNSEQLSVILGVANAVPMKISGLVDNAALTLACGHPRGDCLFYELQRHQTLVNHVRIDDEVVLIDSLIVSDIGYRKMMDKWAAVFADSFIEHSRFDPMYTAASEQALFSRIPQWLGELASQPVINVTLETGDSRYQARIDRGRLLEINDELLNTLRDKGAALTSQAREHLLSPEFASLLALANTDDWSLAPSPASFVEIIESQLDRIKVDQEQLPRITRLHNPGGGASTGVLTPSEPVSAALGNTLYLLINDQATRLPVQGGSVTLSSSGGKLVLGGSTGDAMATISHNARGMQIGRASPQLRLNNKPIDELSTLESGDILTHESGFRAMVITVTGGDA